MNPKDMQQFAREVLNTSGLRDVLRQKVEGINRLESLDGLRDLRLTKMSVAEDNIFMADYEAIASQSLYPHLRARLIENGVITEHNALRSGTGNKGQPDEYESVVMGWSGNSIQASLKVYNPDYKG